MSTKYPDGVTVLQNSDELLLRQVPTAVLQDNGLPMSGGFLPGAGHDGMLSTLRESVGAEKAFLRWDGSSPSAGTWAVSVGESVGLGLTAVDDSALENMPDDHASIDFNPVPSGKRRQVARKLRDRAIARKRLHPPVED